MSTKVQQPDPFAQLITDLDTDAKQLSALIPVLEKTIGIVNALDPVPMALHALDRAHAAYNQHVKTVGDLLGDVSDVPGIHEVRDPIHRAIGDVEHIARDVGDGIAGLIAAGGRALDAGRLIRGGLHLAEDVVHEASVKIPGVLNTLRILDYLLDIAMPLSEIFADTFASKNLGPIIDELVQMKEDVDEAAKPFDHLLGIFQAGTKDIIGALDELSSTVLKLVQHAHEAFDSAVRHLQDVIDPLQTLKSAVSDIPHCVKSVADWLSDKFHTVLKHTGLDRVADGLANALVSALNFGTGLIDRVTTGLQVGLLTTQQTLMGLANAKLWRQAWDTLMDKLGAYAAKPESKLRDLIHRLVNAFFGGKIDPDKDNFLPDWKVPTLDGSDSVPQAVRSAEPQTARAIAALADLRGSTPLPRPCPGHATPALLATLPRSAQGDGTDALSAALTGTTTALASAQGITTALASQLRAFDAVKHLPAGLGAQLTDLATMLSFTSDLTSFVQTWANPKLPLTGVSQGLEDLATATGALPAEAEAVITAAAPIDAAVGQVLQTAPLESAFTQGISVLGGWGSASATLCTLIAIGRQLDTEGTHASAIDAVQSTVQQRAAALAEQVGAIGHLAGQAQETASHLSTALTTVATAYQALADQSTLVRAQWQPTLHEVAHDLALADGILTPLGCLFDVYEVKPCNDPVKQTAAMAIPLLTDATDAALQTFAGSLRQSLDHVLGRALPIDATAGAIDRAQSAVETQGPTIQALCKTLSTQLVQLQTALAAARSYTRDGETTPTTSVFIDQALADSMASLIDAFNPSP